MMPLLVVLLLIMLVAAHLPRKSATEHPAAAGGAGGPGRVAEDAYGGPGTGPDGRQGEPQERERKAGNTRRAAPEEAAPPARAGWSGMTAQLPRSPLKSENEVTRSLPCVLRKRMFQR